MDFEISIPVLLVLIFGLVEFVKQLGITGNSLRLVSMGVGIGLGVIFRLRVLYPEWGSWIDIGFFGLAAGLTACGIYGFLDKRIPKVD